MKWFRTCRTAEEGKSLYRKLVKEYHPDNGGNADIFKQINNEFTMWWNTHKDIHYSTETGETYEETEHRTTETAEEFIEIIENLRTLDGINVELCGSWLWISGNTYPHKDKLLMFGCRWSRSKKEWYWAKDLTFTHYKTGKSKSWIRTRYGSEMIDTTGRVKIQG